MGLEYLNTLLRTHNIFYFIFIHYTLYHKPQTTKTKDPLLMMRTISISSSSLPHLLSLSVMQLRYVEQSSNIKANETGK